MGSEAQRDGDEEQRREQVTVGGEDLLGAHKRPSHRCQVGE